MISRDQAIEQFMRMAQLSFPPKGRAREELLDAIRTSDTSAVAAYCVTNWIEFSANFPRPAEIRPLISAENQRIRTVVSEEEEALRRSACARCQDHGLYGGQIGTGKFDGPWKWCDCPAGLARRERETYEIEHGLGEDALGRAPRLLDSVAEANQAREKLIRRFGHKPLPGMLRQMGAEDQYHGDF